MKIRKGKISDAKTLLKILNKTPELQIERSIETYDKEWVRGILTKTRENITLIIEDNQEIIGFLIAHYLPSVSQIIINDVYVHPKYRRRGIASKLTRKIEIIAKNKKVKYLTGLVQTENKKMQNLKKKLNYIKRGTFIFYEKMLR